MCCDSAAFNQEKALYVDSSQPLGKFLPQLHSIAEGEGSGLRDASGALMPPCIIMEKGEALDVWIESSGDEIDLFTGLQVRSLLTSVSLVLPVRFAPFTISLRHPSSLCSSFEHLH